MPKVQEGSQGETHVAVANSMAMGTSHAHLVTSIRTVDVDELRTRFALSTRASNRSSEGPVNPLKVVKRFSSRRSHGQVADASSPVSRGGSGTGSGSGGSSSAGDNPSPVTINSPPYPTTVADHHGPNIFDANVHLLFMGDAWSLPDTTPTVTDVVKALQTLLNGPYLGELKQYRCHFAQIADVQIIHGSGVDPSAAAWSDADYEEILGLLIWGGLLPALVRSTGYNEVFAFITLPVEDQTGSVRWSGYHATSQIEGNETLSWLRVEYTNPNVDTVTQAFSHEFVELCSDPQGDGFYLPAEPQGYEIGDVCQNQFGSVGGVSVQKYWSATADACVMPTLPNSPVPAGASRTVTVTVSVLVSTGISTPTAAVYTSNHTRTAILDNNFVERRVVISTPSFPSEAGLSVSLRIDLKWNTDFSISTSFGANFFNGYESKVFTNGNLTVAAGASHVGLPIADMVIDGGVSRASITAFITNG